jgi:hypothetical protein
MPRDFFDPTPEQQNIVLVDAVQGGYGSNTRTKIVFSVPKKFPAV